MYDLTINIPIFSICVTADRLSIEMSSLGDDEVVTRIQAAFRGHIGRKLLRPMNQAEVVAALLDRARWGSQGAQQRRRSDTSSISQSSSITDWDLTLECLGRLGQLSDTKQGTLHIISCPGSLASLLELLKITVRTIKASEPEDPAWHFSNKIITAAGKSSDKKNKSTRIMRSASRLHQHNVQCQERVLKVLLRLLVICVKCYQDSSWHRNRSKLSLDEARTNSNSDNVETAEVEQDLESEDDHQNSTLNSNDMAIRDLASYLILHLSSGDFFNTHMKLCGFALRLLARSLEYGPARACLLQRAPSRKKDKLKNKGPNLKKTFRVLIAILDDCKLDSPRLYAYVLRCLVLLVSHSKAARRTAVESTDLIEAAGYIISEYGRAGGEANIEGNGKESKTNNLEKDSQEKAGDKMVALHGVGLFCALANKNPEAIMDLLACNCVAMFINFTIVYHYDGAILQSVFSFLVSMLVNGGPKAGMEILPFLSSKLAISSIVTAIRMFPGQHTLCRMGCKLLGVICSIVAVNPREKDLESGSDDSDIDDEDEESVDNIALSEEAKGKKLKRKVASPDVILYRIYVEERVQQVVCDAFERLGKNGRGATLSEKGRLDPNTPWGEVQRVVDFLLMWCGMMSKKNEMYM